MKEMFLKVFWQMFVFCESHRNQSNRSSYHRQQFLWVVALTCMLYVCTISSTDDAHGKHACICTHASTCTFSHSNTHAYILQSYEG
jgi:hypothetical protein